MSALDRIRQIVSDSDSIDADVVTAEVVDTLTTGEKVEAFDVIARDYVGSLLRARRRVPMPADDAMTTTRTPRSSKWQRAAEWVRRYPVDIDGEDRSLATLTADECDEIARQRRDLAAQNVAVAEKFEKLAAYMRERGLTRVDQCSSQTVMEILR